MRLLPLILLLLVPGLAQLESVSISTTVEPPVVHERIIVNIENRRDTPLYSSSFSLPYDAEVVAAEDEYGELPHYFIINEKKTLIYNFSQPVVPGEKRTLIFEYTTKEPLKRVDSGYLFELRFAPSTDVSLEHTLTLGTNYALNYVEPQGRVSVSKDKASVAWILSPHKGDTIQFAVQFAGKKTINVETNYIMLSIPFIIAFLLFIYILRVELGSKPSKKL